MADLLRLIAADAREALSWWWRAIRIAFPWWLSLVALLAGAELVWRAWQ